MFAPLFAFLSRMSMPRVEEREESPLPPALDRNHQTSSAPPLPTSTSRIYSQAARSMFAQRPSRHSLEILCLLTMLCFCTDVGEGLMGGLSLVNWTNFGLMGSQANSLEGHPLSPMGPTPPEYCFVNTYSYFIRSLRVSTLT